VAKALIFIPSLTVQAHRRVTADERGERMSVHRDWAWFCSLLAPQSKHLVSIPHPKAHSVHCPRQTLVTGKDYG
jgi:hypothetical protein